MKKQALLAILFFCVATSMYASPAGYEDSTVTINSMQVRYQAAINRLKGQGAILRKYATDHKYNSDYCFLVDMSLPSGKKRLFIYNLRKDSVEYAGMVAHGIGSDRPGADQLLFSNTINSGMTSLGKYSIGKSYYGNFGLAHKLHGLDSTNNNAYKRAVVLHSYTQMPDIEVYPDFSPLSAGCPMVSADCLTLLRQYINASRKPILLWIYN